MSDYETKDLSGSLFRNDKKDESHPKWPDYSGTMRVNNVDYWLSAWVKTTKAGQKYFGLTLKPKDQKAKQEPEQKDSDSLPF